MFEKDDEKYLKRVIGRNEVILFLGAGFSRGATNRLKEPYPTGVALGQKIWSFLKYQGSYDNTPLTEMYQAFLNSGIKREEKKLFLEGNLLSDSIPLLYDIIASPFWYKIYQLNIDDVIDKVYGKAGKGLHNLIFPKDEYKERDQSLERTQVVYLHGKLPCNPEDVIFSTKQYAKAQLTHQPLYGQFVYDYAVKPTIFVGTDLNEQIFERYIESREGKSGYGELRPRSFLITPSLSPVKADNFRNQYNVHHVPGTTDDFLNWLKEITPELPEKNQILKTTFPNLLSLSVFSALTNVSHKSLTEFATAFNRIPSDFVIKQDHRSGYLQGSSPTWNDIFKNLDINRSVTDDIFFSIDDVFLNKTKTEKIKVYSILGTAGSGKSTILKRMGLQLSQNGRTVFLCYSEFIPRIDIITDVLSAIKERVVILFDNAKNAIPQFKQLIEEFNKLEYPPVLVFALRTNQFDKLNLFLDPQAIDHTSFSIPDLDDREINDLIELLDNNNLLGLLKGMNERERIREFKNRAKKQILVAMKEATNGKSFNEIIRDEFKEINPQEAQILCLCVALNTELGFTNSKQDFVGFSKTTHAEALNYLNSVLKGIILWVGGNDKFMIRHRILADFMIKHCASPDTLKEAYIRVLSILAPELKNTQTYSRKFNLYKSLVNHNILYNRFKNNIDKAREVYDSISDFFHGDAHFWLQYGSLEIEGDGGDLGLAENYLNQAESINPNYHYIQNAKCSLYYRQSYSQNDFSVALEYKIKADELGERLLGNTMIDDPHTHHILCRGKYYFILKWVTDVKEKSQKLQELKMRIENAFKQYPRDRKLEQALNAITRSYLQLGINNENLPNVEIPE